MGGLKNPLILILEKSNDVTLLKTLIKFSEHDVFILNLQNLELIALNGDGNRIMKYNSIEAFFSKIKNQWESPLFINFSRLKIDDSEFRLKINRSLIVDSLSILFSTKWIFIDSLFVEIFKGSKKNVDFNLSLRGKNKSFFVSKIISTTFYLLSERVDLKELTLTSRPDKSKYFKRFLRELTNKVLKKKEHWDIMLFKKGELFKKLDFVSNSFLADPFLFKTQDKLYLFYERFDFNKKKGIIGVYDVYQDVYRDVLEEEFHLSFPNVFELGGKYCMIPESSESGQLRMYEATDFPNYWKLLTIIDSKIKLYDPIPISISADRIEILASQKIFDIDLVENEALFHFVYDKTEGGFVLKHRRLVKFDANGGRMAGNLFMKDGELFRPGHNTIYGYGSGISFFKIIPTWSGEYSEQIVSPLFEGPLLSEYVYKSAHTYNCIDEWEVIDIKK